MNSLSQLNNESLKSIPFADSRPTAITFTENSPSTQVIVIYPNEDFLLTPGTSITSMISAESEFITSTDPDTEGLTYNVILSTVGNIATVANVDRFVSNIASLVTFAGVPLKNEGYTHLEDIGSGNLYASFSFNNTPAYTNVTYTVKGIKSVSDWNYVKEPLIKYDVATLSSNLFHSEIISNSGAYTKDWYTTINPVIPYEWTTVNDQFFDPVYYEGGSVEAVALTRSLGYRPNVAMSSNTSLQSSTYTATISGTDNNAFGNLYVSLMPLGGTQSWNTTSKELTITGNAAQFNTMNVVMYPAHNYYGTFRLKFDLYNPVTDYTSTVYKYMRCNSESQGANKFTEPATYYYDDNAVNYIGSDAPTAQSINIVNTFTVTVIPDTANSVSSMSTTGTGGTSSWNAGTQTLTITGTKDQVNSHVQTISLTPVADFNSNFHLTYRITGNDSPSGNIDISQVQTMTYTNVLDDVENVAVSRDYTGNTTNNLFKVNVPQITETVSGANYIVTLTTTAGYIGLNTSDISKSYVFSGTKEQVNEKMYNINFYPDPDVFGAQTLRIQIVRNSTTLADQTVELVGSENYPELSPATYKITSTQMFYPTFEQSQYMSCDIMLVGGGGGGAKVSSGTGGGGGSGAVFGATDVYLPFTGVLATIGTAGAGATTNNSNGSAGGATTLADGGLISYTAVGGDGGEYSTRNGGNYSSPYSNSSGTSSGGTWYHKGAAGVGSTGGGGGGAGSAGISVFPGTGLYPADFDLVKYTGATEESSLVAFGGAAGSDQTPTSYHYGAGGSSRDAGVDGGSGKPGVVVIRFY